MPTTRAVTSPEHHFEAPNSLAAFVRLCDKHGRLQIFRQEWIEAGDTMGDIAERFIKRYAPGWEKIPLYHLIPFITRGHDHWGLIMRAIIRALKRYGILGPNYSLDGRNISCPARKRVVDLCD